jgi:hypothetical protein
MDFPDFIHALAWSICLPPPKRIQASASLIRPSKKMCCHDHQPPRDDRGVTSFLVDRASQKIHPASIACRESVADRRAYFEIQAITG